MQMICSETKVACPFDWQLLVGNTVMEANNHMQRREMMRLRSPGDWNNHK